jgi:cyanophycinase
MSNSRKLPLSLKPIVSYPREAQVGETYLLTVDLQLSGEGNEWEYEAEEYPIYCRLETAPLFKSKAVGEPAIVLHRFGGSYGAAKFLLTAAQQELEGEIKITLVNGWGVPIRVLNLRSVRVREQITHPLIPNELTIETAFLQQEEQQKEQLLNQQVATLIIGDAEDKVHGREILQTFWTRAGGSEAIIAIVPSASREPVLTGQRYQQIFEEMGAKSIHILDIRDRAQGEDPYFQQYVEECTGVFLSGGTGSGEIEPKRERGSGSISSGDQLRLCGLLADTPLMDRVRQRTKLGEITLAGTGAGAMVMGHHMIAGGGSGEPPSRALVDMAMGLGIFPEVIVDSLFFNRNRMARFLGAIAGHPERLGVGIDEDTCAMFEPDGMIQVIGQGTVTVIDARELTHTNAEDTGPNAPLSLHNLRVHILTQGDGYYLRQYRPIPQVSPSSVFSQVGTSEPLSLHNLRVHILTHGDSYHLDQHKPFAPMATNSNLSTKTALLVIGGDEDKVHGREILQTFWTHAGGLEGTIAIIPSASRKPTLIGDRYQTIFEEMGAKEVRVLDIRDRAQGEDPFFLEYIEECTGVFLSGGDQLRLCGLLADTPLMERVRQRVQLGEITLAGTSSGAMVMGHHMIAGGGSGESPNRALVDMAMGLSIIPEVIVDSSFFNRNRMARLLSAISAHPEKLGIGIDADTCAMFDRDGRMQVIGRSGAVTIIDPREMSYTKV